MGVIIILVEKGGYPLHRESYTLQLAYQPQPISYELFPISS